MTTILRSIPVYGDEFRTMLMMLQQQQQPKPQSPQSPPPPPPPPPPPHSTTSDGVRPAAADRADRNNEEDDERVTPDFLKKDDDESRRRSNQHAGKEEEEEAGRRRTDDDEESDATSIRSSSVDSSSDSGSDDDDNDNDEDEDEELPVQPLSLRGSSVDKVAGENVDAADAARSHEAVAAGPPSHNPDRRPGGGGGGGGGGKGKKNKKERHNAKLQSEYRRHMEQIPCREFDIELGPTHEANSSTAVQLCVPNCLWPEPDRRDEIDRLLSRRYYDMEETSSDVAAAKQLLSIMPSPTAACKVIIWWMRSGRFAGGVFENESCVAHATKARYTTRRGQGKSQGAMDNQKGKNAKSVGAQLRRAGEVQLWDDVRNVAVSWTPHFQSAHLVLIMVPPVMHANLWKDTFVGVLNKDDDRIRTRIPLNVKRPGHDALVVVHRVVTNCTIRQRQRQQKSPQQLVATDNEPIKSKPIQPSSESSSKSNHLRVDPKPAIDWPPYTALHEAAARGRVDELVKSLGQDDVNVNAVAGPFLQTPLHLAALAGSSAVRVLDGTSNGTDNDEEDVTKVMEALSTDDTNSNAMANAAECVYQLLVTGHADPAVLDARDRPPYYLASHDSVRIAFRRARAVLENDDSSVAWDWSASKIGQALSDQDVEAKKEREAEKKRQKKQRQKERKAKDKAEAEAAERQRQQQMEEQRKREEAKRIRDELQPKSNTKATNVCDYCQKVCVGKRRRDMYQRLEYAYCSTECVQLHKRELMASAAMARFQSPS